ncbi:hypothetical protein LCGC14_2913220 [marine sediment metagenome]|uniref:Uncharacterized protein n=1 Tax=marine sediment metagenome TaxID=412755 RepID=A0A0F8YCT3_9ZZZZ
MMEGNEKIITVLRNPPYKKAPCSWCGATGIVNLRGMITSDPCPKCRRGEANVKDYSKWAKQIRQALKA